MRSIGLASLVLVALAAGCQKQPAPPLVPPDYRSWARVHDEPLRYPIPGHLDKTRVVYINPIGQQATMGTGGAGIANGYPQGTIIVKEVFPTLGADVSGLPPSLTVMIKDRSHKLARGGWVWVVAEPPSGTERIVDYEFCFECHADANEPHPYGDGNPRGEFRDFVFFPYKLKR